MNSNMTKRPGWLDSVPHKWSVVPSKAAFIERRQRSKMTDEHLTPSQKLGVLPQEDYMRLTGTKVVLNLSGQENMKHVERNDFIIHLRSFQGGIEHSTIEGKVSMAYTVLTPRSERVLPGYFRWLLKADAFIQELQSTTDQLRDGQSIKYATFAKIRLPLPPLDEQRAIADYLDQEVAQIDALVAKQEEFIGLLGERRRSAVRALFPRTSGGGLADKLHRRVRMGNGSTPRSSEDRYWVGGSVPWMNSSVVNAPEAREPSRFVTEAAIEECHLPLVRKGSVLVALTGQGKTRGMATILRIDSTINQHLAYITPDERFWIAEYLQWLLYSKYDELRRISGENGATRGGLTVGDLGSLPVVLPSLEEQYRVVDELVAVTSRIDALVAKAEEHIALAKERRSALITAAVTGQIDLITARKAS